MYNQMMNGVSTISVPIMMNNCIFTIYELNKCIYNNYIDVYNMVFFCVAASD